MIEFAPRQEFPPFAKWPAPVRKLVDELLDLQDRRNSADRAVADLVGDNSPAAWDAIRDRLAKEDAPAQAAAARAGTAAVATAADRYATDLANARQEVAAVTAALGAVTADVLAATVTHRDAILAAVDATATEGHKAFTDAVAALEPARVKLYESEAVREFVERVTAANPQGRHAYDPRPPDTLTGALGFGVPRWPDLLRSLRAEADALDPATTDPTDEVVPDGTTATTTTTTATAAAAAAAA